jgi:hypothetical protein
MPTPRSAFVVTMDAPNGVGPVFLTARNRWSSEYPEAQQFSTRQEANRASYPHVTEDGPEVRVEAAE